MLVLTVVAAVGACASSAWAAFPGRDGQLVVANGHGLALVSPGSGAARPICAEVTLCGDPSHPRFSANGRAIAFIDAVTRRPVVLAADGSCLWCLRGPPLTQVTGVDAAFTGGGLALTIAGGGGWQVPLTGGGARRVADGVLSDTVWSSRGVVAVVRGGWVWVGRFGRGGLRRLSRGGSPSFSPDGGRLAFSRGGYVWTVGLRDRMQRRLVRGGAPAWSPAGGRIAYIGAGGAIEVVSATGGRPHRVGTVRGSALDWQSLPLSAARSCVPPAGSVVVASSRQAIVFSPPGYLGAFSGAVDGCLREVGRTHRLLDPTKDYPFDGRLIAVRLAGRFVALAPEYINQYGYASQRAILYDLANGKSTPLADVSWDWSQGTFVSALDSLVLDSSGFTAWRETTGPRPQRIGAISCPSVSLCVAGDALGNVLSSTDPTGGPAAWSAAEVLSNEPILSIACPSVTLCIALPGGGDMLTATHPTGGASAWTKTTLDPGITIGAPSCPSASLCVAGGSVNGNAAILTSTDPAAGASSWRIVTLPSRGAVGSMSCPSVSLCVGADDGRIFTSTDPIGSARAWTATNVERSGFLGPVVCPSISLCIAADNNYNEPGGPRVLTTTNPTGGASAWTRTTIETGAPGSPITIGDLSCPSVALCVAGDVLGNIVTSTNPAGGEKTWKRVSVAPFVPNGNEIRGVSCPSVSMCLATVTNGEIFTSTHPTGPATAWHRATIDVPGCPRLSLPCISEQLFAADDQGTRLIDAAPAGSRSSIGSVTLGGDSQTLTWAHDGARRSLELR